MSIKFLEGTIEDLASLGAEITNIQGQTTETTRLNWFDMPVDGSHRLATVKAGATIEYKIVEVLYKGVYNVYVNRGIEFRHPADKYFDGSGLVGAPVTVLGSMSPFGLMSR